MATRQDPLSPKVRGAAPRRHPSAPSLPPPRQCAILLADRHISYTLRISARARRLYLRVKPTTGLEVVVPRGVSMARAEDALREKAQWVLSTLDRMAIEESARATPPLHDGQTLPYAGDQIQLALRSGAPAARYRATLRDGILTLTLSDLDQDTIHHALTSWYRRQADVVFAERLIHCNRMYQLTYGRVTIKEQKSRWGSCSRAGNLNFNWRLLLAPLPVLDYVVTHELAHLSELNHSPSFWRLVASACPEYKSHRAWLRQHGRDLRF